MKSPRVSSVTPSPALSIDQAAWLGEDVLLLVGPWAPPPTLEASLVQGNQPVRLAAQGRTLPVPADLEGESTGAGILRIHLPAGGVPQELTGTLDIRMGSQRLTLTAEQLAPVLTDLPGLIRDNVAGLEPEAREDMMAFLGEALAEHRDTPSVVLSKNLMQIRDALRERLSYGVLGTDQTQNLSVDSLLGIDDRIFYVKGWMCDTEAPITRLTAISPEGARVELLNKLYRHPRLDVRQFYGGQSDDSAQEEPGFLGQFELPFPSYLPTDWVFEIGNRVGSAKELRARNVLRDPALLRRQLLSDLSQEKALQETLKLQHTFPALSRLQERCHKAVQVDSVTQYGPEPANPEVSIVVPLYERIDFLEHQLAQFVHDPEIRQTDLVYVLDSPELAENLVRSAGKLARLYGIPFRTAILKQNAGYSEVNNVGASLARAGLLLLLNSDVLPDKPGWLAPMKAFYRTTPRIGALGPKLLFEDDSLQHAGMFFNLLEEGGEWENRHYFKGFHRRLPVANVARPVPAVTGACLLIATELYRRHGGLRGLYVQGDYEDSDLCLRLMEAGLENWYLPQVELYHLEGQSYPTALRTLATQYNRWLHTHLWRPRIEAAMKRFESLMWGT
jgi:GT2 family glycosyltransferase